NGRVGAGARRADAVGADVRVVRARAAVRVEVAGRRAAVAVVGGVAVVAVLARPDDSVAARWTLDPEVHGEIRRRVQSDEIGEAAGGEPQRVVVGGQGRVLH